MIDKIAVVGDKDSVLAFKASGLDVYPTTIEDSQNIVKALAKECAVIFVTEEIATNIPEIIEKYKSKSFPAIIPIPTGVSSTGIGIEGIRKNVEKAIGADILFKD